MEALFLRKRPPDRHVSSWHHVYAATRPLREASPHTGPSTVSIAHQGVPADRQTIPCVIGQYDAVGPPLR
jgi:hypothetical protein